MDAYLNILVDQLSSIENKTSARNAKDLANSPELQSILSFFATRESIIVEKHKSVLDLGKVRQTEQYNRKAKQVAGRELLVLVFVCSFFDTCHLFKL
jgi:diacylglycerol kinase